MDNIVDVFKDESYTSALSQEPITLPEAKQACRVDFTDDDSYLTALISQARAIIENYCHISIVLKTITCTAVNKCDDIPYNSYNPISRWDYAFYGISMNGKWFELPYGPVKNIVSVSMIEGATITTLTENDGYKLRGTNFTQMKIDRWGENCLIVFYAGFTVIPYDLKRAILAQLAFIYENRGDSVNRYASQNVGICEQAQNLAEPFRRIWQ